MVKRSATKAVSGGSRMLAVPLLLLLFSCGIFSPRSSETPEVPGRVDPFNFAAIMAGTGHTFTQLSLSAYENLFVDAFVYDDFNSGPSSKASLISKLQTIQTQYENIQVQWGAGQIWTSADNDTMKLSGLKYYIFTDGNTSGAPADSGSSNFIVVNNQDWLICQWTDIPARQGKSFFAP
ncbi:MAG: hypothetical protein ABSF80_02090 [Chitinispirillaceae bacterium]|jgi:hypothetical protein